MPPPTNRARLIRVVKRPAGTQPTFSNLDGARCSVESQEEDEEEEVKEEEEGDRCEEERRKWSRWEPRMVSATTSDTRTH